jgi:hypothetical protein
MMSHMTEPRCFTQITVNGLRFAGISSSVKNGFIPEANGFLPKLVRRAKQRRLVGRKFHKRLFWLNYLIWVRSAVF